MTWRFKHQNSIFVAIIIYLLWVAAYVGVDHQQNKQQLFSELNAQLDAAALAVPLILPNGLHKQGMQAGDISREQSLQHAIKLSELARLSDVAFVYSLIYRGGKVYFTASSATDDAIETGEDINWYFDHYADVAPKAIDVFKTKKKIYIEYTDKLGSFRSVFLPMRSPDNSLYVVAADIEISHINGLLNQRLWQSATVAALFLIFAIPLMLGFSVASRKLAQRLEQRVKESSEALANSEATIDSVLEHSPVGIVHYNSAGELLRVNRCFEKITGQRRDKLLRTSLVYWLDNSTFTSAINASLLGQKGHFEAEVYNLEQQRKLILCADFVPMRSKSEEIIGGVAVFDDRTQQLETMLNLKKLSLAIEHSPSVVFMMNRQGIIEYANPRFSQITGYDIEEALGKTPRLLKSSQENSDYADYWSQISEGKLWSGESQNCRKNGETYWARESTAPISNDLGEITHFVVIQEDITEARRVNEENRYYASHDMLTGLVNRYEFERRLDRAVKTAQLSDGQHAMCFIDLDQFKVINDTCGHAAGDELLRQLATMLSRNLRRRDTLARIGGDEFALLMVNCPMEQAEKVVKNIHHLVEQFVFCWGEHKFTIGSSIGLTAIDQYTPDTVAVLKHADSACYIAKEQGRNRIHIYHDEDENLVRREGEMQWVNVIKRALQEHQLCLFGQLIEPVSDSDGDIIYEVLVRMIGDDGNIIGPGCFLPAAERYNLSTLIDKWVVDNTLNWLEKNLSQLGKVDHFAINLSGQSLGDENFLTSLQQRLQSSKLPAEMLCFEITETAAIANLSTANQFIATLREHGCRFSLDDFGSGLSSFAYLKNLPVDYLKIDGMFVKDILDDPIDKAMVKSINEIGQIMQMKTIAEFVENTEIRDQLREIGVDFVQGYGVGKPQPLDELLIAKSTLATITQQA